MKVQLFAAALLAAATVAFAQDVPKAGETITVSVRNVDLVITDSKGNRVQNVPKDDLTLFENGTKREITNFAELRADAPQPAAQPIARRLLIVFDVNTLTMNAKQQAVVAAKAFLARQLRTNDRAALYVTGNGLTKLVDWTNDAATINAALVRVNEQAATAIAMQRDAAERRIMNIIGDMKMIEDSRSSKHSGAPGGGDTSAPGFGSGGSSGSTPGYSGGNSGNNSGANLPQSPGNGSFDLVIPEARLFAEEERRDVQHSLAMMSSAMNIFGTSGGKRVLIVAGGGLPTRPGADLFAWLQNVSDSAQRGEFGRGAANHSDRFSQLEVAKYDAMNLIRPFGESAVKKGVAIYALDSELGGMQSMNQSRGSRSDTGADFLNVASRADGYQYLANTTGGIALLGAAPAVAFQEVAKDLDSYYSIAYRSDGTNELPKLEVKSKSGYKVRATLASAPPTRDELMQDRVAAAHLEKLPLNDLGISLRAEPPVADGERRKVQVHVLIPVKSLKLLQEGDSMTGGFNVYVSTGDSSGASSDVAKQTYQIKWPADKVPSLLDKSITYNINVTLEPGRSQISVGVIDQRSEQSGFERIAL